MTAQSIPKTGINGVRSCLDASMQGLDTIFREEVFDFARVDVLTAADDQFIEPPGDLHVTVRVHAVLVARVQPAGTPPQAFEVRVTIRSVDSAGSCQSLRAALGRVRNYQLRGRSLGVAVRHSG